MENVSKNYKERPGGILPPAKTMTRSNDRAQRNESRDPRRGWVLSTQISRGENTPAKNVDYGNETGSPSSI